MIFRTKFAITDLQIYRIKTFGDWTHAAGTCRATGAFECGPGFQFETRDCIDGTIYKCRESDRKRTVTCAVAGTELPVCEGNKLFQNKLAKQLESLQYIRVISYFQRILIFDVSGCKTTGGDPCVFPFIYRGTEYNSCTTASMGVFSSGLWCSTETNDDNTYNGKWGSCSDKECPAA